MRLAVGGCTMTNRGVVSRLKLTTMRRLRWPGPLHQWKGRFGTPTSRGTLGALLILLGQGCSLRSLDALQKGEATGGAGNPSETGGSPNVGVGGEGTGDATGGALPATGGSATTPTGGSTAAGGSSTGGDASADGGAGGTVTEAPCELCVVGAAIVHRYGFDGTGTQVTDSVGSAHGTVVNTELTGTGSLALAGRASSQYVDLPDGILSALTDATLEAWITWDGGQSPWQRIFDIGDQDGDGSGPVGRSYLFLSPSGGVDDELCAAYRRPGSEEVLVRDDRGLPEGQVQHVAVVVDSQERRLLLYRGGTLQRSATLSEALSDINDVNVWLGRSQFQVDPWFAGIFHEFRVYDAALTETQLGASLEAGPDAELPSN